MEHYVVRLWVPAPSAGDATEADPGMHGVVSHVSTGRTQTFRDGRELLRRLIDLRSDMLGVDQMSRMSDGDRRGA